MTMHSSATVREIPHVNQTSRTNIIVTALKQRAQAVLNDRSIDPESRAIIRYALETNDPWLAELVRRADAGETVVDSAGFLKISSTNEEKIAALAELICRAGDEAGTKSQIGLRKIGYALGDSQYRERFYERAVKKKVFSMPPIVLGS